MTTTQHHPLTVESVGLGFPQSTRRLRQIPLRPLSKRAKKTAPNLLPALAAALHGPSLLQYSRLPPDPWQCDLFASRQQPTLLLCSRQVGKSTTVAAITCVDAISQPDALTIVISPSLRQSKEFYRKLLVFFRNLNRPIPVISETSLTLELETGARIVALPAQEDTIRCFSGVYRIIIDEASRVPDEIYKAVRPMMAVSKGRVTALTTPFGRRGWFYDEWTSGSSEWNRIEVPATACPRIPASFLAQERISLGPRWFSQEYECKFTDRQDQLFAGEWLDRFIDPTLEPLFPGFF